MHSVFYTCMWLLDTLTISLCEVLWHSISFHNKLVPALLLLGLNDFYLHYIDAVDK